MSIVLLALKGIPAIQPGSNLAAILADAIEASRYGLKEDDCLVICQKIVSKAEGRVVDLASVDPSERAQEFAAKFDKNPAVVELALQEASEVLRMEDGHLITQTRNGLVAANSGLDRSNQNGEGQATLLPVDSDASARRIRTGLNSRLGVAPGVIITDTVGRPWRLGQVDVAIGCAGIEALDSHDGREDWSGRELAHTALAVADQAAAAAGMLMGKADGVPAVLLRGYRFRRGEGGVSDLVRPRELDLFR